MTREEALEGAREKWKECPAEEEYRDWWDNVGSVSCSLCQYHKVINKICPLKREDEYCAACCGEWQDCGTALGDYPAFVIAFQKMHDRIYALTVDDLPERKKK